MSGIRQPLSLIPLRYGEISRLLPEWHDRYPDLPPATNDETLARTRLLEAIAGLIQSLAERRPLLPFIDDLQWADFASLNLLHFHYLRGTGRVGARHCVSWSASHSILRCFWALRNCLAAAVK